MTKGPNRLNLLASWERNVNPALKVASLCATYSRERSSPAFLEARIYFFTEGHARRWLSDHSAKYVGGRLFPLFAHGKSLTQYKLHIDLSARTPLAIANQTGIAKYRKLIYGLRSDQYSIDWQSPDYIARTYGTQEEFEAALCPTT